MSKLIRVISRREGDTPLSEPLWCEPLAEIWRAKVASVPILTDVGFGDIIEYSQAGEEYLLTRVIIRISKTWLIRISIDEQSYIEDVGKLCQYLATRGIRYEVCVKGLLGISLLVRYKEADVREFMERSPVPILSLA